MSESPIEQAASAAEPPQISTARFKHRVAVNELDLVENLAQKLAPAFRDKFDFSEEKNYADMAEMAYKAARAMLAKQRQELEIINQRLAADIELAHRQIASEKAGAQ